MEYWKRERRERRVWAGMVAGSVCAVGLLALASHFLPPARPAVSILPRPALPPAPLLPLQGVVVVLDPGHGGQDPGAVCDSVSEAALAYRTATEVAAGLRAQGAQVVYTVQSRTLDPALAIVEPPLARPTDAVLTATGQPLKSRRGPQPLWARAARARQVWAQRARHDPDARRDVFFLSLHYDEFRGESVSGSMVCVDRRMRPMPRLASVLAGTLTPEFARNCEFHGVHGVSAHELGVLDPAYNPIPERVLLEVTTLSNTQDALQAGDPAWRGEMARRIVEAIMLVHQPKKIIRL